MAIKGVITRGEWHAREPDGDRNKWVPPLKGLTVHWEGTGAPPARLHSSCANIVRNIQGFHMFSRGWSDIAYNWLVCNHGYVFIGRGWAAASGANGTDPANEHYAAVSWMGIVGTHPSDEALSALHSVRQWLINRNAREVHPHHDWISTECPGPDLTAWINDGAKDPFDKPQPPPPPPAPAKFLVTNPDGQVLGPWNRQSVHDHLDRMYAAHANDDTNDPIEWKTSLFPKGAPKP